MAGRPGGGIKENGGSHKMKNMLDVINKDGEMKALYQVSNGPTVVGAWMLGQRK